jgi:hypothetical protein
MRRLTVTGVLVMAICSSAFAQSLVTRTRPAWEWTLDERLTERLDRGHNQERILAYRPATRAVHSQTLLADDRIDAKPQFEYIVDGHRNPELFLPHELFDMLLSGLNPDESMRTRQREYYRTALRSLGYDDTAFWNALASVTGKYLTVRFVNGQHAVNERCHMRFEALEAARNLFGQAKFERTLYTVIAPTAFYSAVSSDDVKPEAQLRRAERGCR